MKVDMWDKKEHRTISVDNIKYIYPYTTYIKLITFNGTETKYETNKYELCCAEDNK